MVQRIHQFGSISLMMVKRKKKKRNRDIEFKFKIRNGRLFVEVDSFWSFFFYLLLLFIIILIGFGLNEIQRAKSTFKDVIWTRPSFLKYLIACWLSSNVYWAIFIPFRVILFENVTFEVRANTHTHKTFSVSCWWLISMDV